MEAVPRPSADGPRTDLAERWQRWRSDPRIGIAVLLCIALAAGVAWFRAGISPASPQQADVAQSAAVSPSSTSSTTAATTSTTTAAVVVDVAGAVRAPGVVTLAGGARVVDAIDAAGGAAPGADLSR